MIIHQAHKIELDPTIAQAIYFAKACGVARFSYNWALAEWTKQYRAGLKPDKNLLLKQLTRIKRDQFPWMMEVTKCAPQYAINNLGDAFQKFFKKKAKYPKFKKKGVHDSFRTVDGPKDNLSSVCRVLGYSVKLPIIGKIRMKEKLRFNNGRILSVVISRTAHKWFASFNVEIDHQIPKRENQASVGVDLGIKSLATLSDGTKFENPKALRSNLVKLRRLSKNLSRKKKGSSNRRKAIMKLSKLHYRISCIRKDALHKLTHHLAKNYSLIGIEDLNVKGMLKNKRLSMAISDVGFYEFKRQLLYKSEWLGSQLVIADRFFPSSKKCADCGEIKQSLELSERSWICSKCGSEHDRDVNAAINLKKMAEVNSVMAESCSVTACGEISSGGSNKSLTRFVRSAKLNSMKQEPGKSHIKFECIV